MNVLSVINKKGGCGKTTTAIQIAAGLVRRGYRVLAIDMDEQGNLTSTSRGESGAIGIFDVLTDKEDINDTIQERAESYDIIGGDARLSELDVILTRTGREYKLKRAMDKLKSTYDYIVLDNPPSMGIAVTNALTASTDALITVQADSYNLEGLMAISNFIKEIIEYCNNALLVDGILVTRYNPRINLNKYMYDQFMKIAEAINTRLYTTFIRQSNSINQAQAHKMDIFSYDMNSNGAIDYDTFLNEFLGVK